MKLSPRYLIRGVLDGAISTLGVVIGAFNPDISIILAAGAAGAVANAVSNVMAAFTAEYTGRYQELRQLERATLSDLEGTIHERDLKRKLYRDAFYDGAASFFGGMVPLVPFIYLQGVQALLTAVAVCCVLTGLLGIWIGVMTKQNLIYSFIKLILMTLVTAAICYGISGVIHAGIIAT